MGLVVATTRPEIRQDTEVPGLLVGVHEVEVVAQGDAPVVDEGLGAVLLLGGAGTARPVGAVALAAALDAVGLVDDVPVPETEKATETPRPSAGHTDDVAARLGEVEAEILQVALGPVPPRPAVPEIRPEVGEALPGLVGRTPLGVEAVNGVPLDERPRLGLLLEGGPA